MSRRALDEIELRYSAAIYLEMGLPRWAWFRRWRARREWKAWLAAMRVWFEEDKRVRKASEARRRGRSVGG